MLRYSLGMPLEEEEDLDDAKKQGSDIAKPQAALDKTVRAVLPRHLSPKILQQRMDPPNTVIITCGNPWSMEDIKYAAESNRMRYEKEDW